MGASSPIPSCSIYYMSLRGPTTAAKVTAPSPMPLLYPRALPLCRLLNSGLGYHGNYEPSG